MIVNGTIVVKDSRVLPVKLGKPIRYPVEDKGRFVPIDVGAWLSEHTVGAPPQQHGDHTGLRHHHPKR